MAEESIFGWGYKKKKKKRGTGTEINKQEGLMKLGCSNQHSLCEFSNRKPEVRSIDAKETYIKYECPIFQLLALTEFYAYGRCSQADPELGRENITNLTI